MKTRDVMPMVIAGLLAQLLAAGVQGESATATSACQADRGTVGVIEETLCTEIGHQLRKAHALWKELRVTVAVERTSATPFRVSYKGLRNFKGADGTTPDPDGAFIMNYVGGGVWQGALAGRQFTVPAGSTDNIGLPFVDDPSVIGEWESVDFVSETADFNPKHRQWRGDLYLRSLTFLEGGATAKSQETWTKGLVLHHGDKTASRYEIRDIEGQSYLFFEWKSGDVTIAGMKPCYYVLRKRAAKAAP